MEVIILGGNRKFFRDIILRIFRVWSTMKVNKNGKADSHLSSWSEY